MVEHVEAFRAMIKALGINEFKIISNYNICRYLDVRVFTFNGYYTAWVLGIECVYHTKPNVYASEQEPEIINLLENDEDIEIKRKIELWADKGILV